jgi:hypothetical protein
MRAREGRECLQQRRLERGTPDRDAAQRPDKHDTGDQRRTARPLPFFSFVRATRLDIIDARQ